MKKILFLSLAFLLLTGCKSKKTTGTITGYETDSLFLYKAINRTTCNLTLVGSIPVSKGRFTIDNDSLNTGLYCLSTQPAEREKWVNNYGFLFLEPVPMQIAIGRKEDGLMQITATGSTLEKSAADFAEKMSKEKTIRACDSLNRLFHAALERNDTLEMNRLKEFSIHIREEANDRSKELIDAEIKKYEGTYFALYLYHKHCLYYKNMSTPDEIAETRAYVESYDQASKESIYYTLIEQRLAYAERCVVGAEAPNIIGTDKEGYTVTLTDLRGKYVLIDFWNSECKWCRYERPNLLKTYMEFKDKDFTILGVSSDHNEASWINAIEEDKSFWNQILLLGGEIASTMERYCITSTPHILLLDPNGVILAKELRGEDIYNKVKEYVSI